MLEPRKLAIAFACALALGHVLVAVSIARQPYEVSRAPASERAVIWPLHYDTVHRTGPGADFFALYHAGVKVWLDESPYDGSEEPRLTPPFYGYRYLPILASSLGRVAAVLEPRAAYAGWIACLEILLALALAVLWRRAPSPAWQATYAAALLASSPFFLELHMGQFTFATLTLVCLAGDRLDRGRTAAGAIAFTLAVLLKVFPLAAVPALVRDRRGRIAAAVAIAAVVITNAPYFLGHGDDWRVFWNLNFGPDQDAGYFHGGNYGVVYVWFQLLRDLGHTGAFPHVALVWQLAVLGATAALVVWRKPPMLTGMLALMFAHMISYKHVWEHHASGAVVCAAFLLAQASASAWRGRWIILGCLVLLVLPTPFVLVDALDPTVWDPTPAWSHAVRYVLPLCKALPELVLWGCALALVRRAP